MELTLREIFMIGTPLCVIAGFYFLTRYRLGKVEERADKLNECKVDKELYESDQSHIGATLDRIETSVFNIDKKLEEQGKETRSSISRVHSRIDALVKTNGKIHA